MATTDKAKNTAQQAKGKLKETVGKVSGNDKLRAEGKTDQVKETSSRPARSSRTRSRSNATQRIDANAPDVAAPRRRPRLVGQSTTPRGREEG